MGPTTDNTTGLSLDPRQAWLLWQALDTLCSRLWDTYYEPFLEYCQDTAAPLDHHDTG